MTAVTLGFDAAFALATAMLYTFVGALTLRREASDADGHRALRLFALWWFGLATVTLVGAVRSTLGALGILDLPVHLALTYLTIPPLVALLAGLLYYLLYIHTGNARLLGPVLLYHAVLLVVVVYLVVWQEPLFVQANAWNVTTENARELSGPLVALAIAALLGPVLMASIAYGSLYFRAHERTARYRIATVAGAFTLWFGSSAVAAITGFNEWYWWPVASRVVALVSTVIILLAYKPPRAFREKYGIEPVRLRHEPSGDTMRRALPVTWKLAVARG